MRKLFLSFLLALLLFLPERGWGAIAFTYTESTNTVVVTGGTAETPADFDDFVTDDRAGTDTVLLDAGSPASDLALTYAVRPVEDLAILVKCVVANKTAEADFIFITGKDWRGAAQTESIDVTAGNGSYETTKYWSECTTFDCSDGAAGGGNVWDDGDLTVTQDVWGVVWDYGNGQYTVDAIFSVGNASTTTYFQSTEESVVFTKHFIYTTGATLTLGELYGDWGINGSYWEINPSGDTYIYGSGTLNLYASHLHKASAQLFRFHTATHLKARNSIISCNYYFDESGNRNYVMYSSVDFNRVYICNIRAGSLRATPSTFDNVHIHRALLGISVWAAAVSAPNFFATSVGTDINLDGDNASLTLTDPVTIPTTVNILTSGDEPKFCLVQYTYNAHIADKDGTDLASASVACEYAHLVEGSDSKTYKCIADHTAVDADHKPITGTDWADYWELYDAGGGLGGDWFTGFAYKSGTAEFTTQTTDANGDISEQNVQYKQWYDPAEMLEVRLHKYTISKAGYKTLILDNITVDGPIDWHLELQFIGYPPAPVGSGM